MNFVNDRTQDDGAIEVDIRVCSIRFLERDAVTFATLSVTVTFEGDTTPGGEDEMSLNISFPADPERETIVMIVEKCRLAVIARLKAAAVLIEEIPARTLLFGESPRLR